MERTIKYAALRTVQVDGGKPLILFSAPALEVETWAGVPQKKGDESQEETLGFQRDEDKARVRALSTFLNDSANIVQNPLLCARRITSVGSVSFEPDHGQADLDGPGTTSGTLKVVINQLDAMPLLQLIEGVMAQIENRLTDLKKKEPDSQKVINIRSILRENSEEASDQDESNDEGETDVSEPSGEEAMTALFTDETHVVDFWHELAARAAAIQQLSGFSGDEAAGFTRDALASFLKPVIVVDGQHRLRGAIEAAKYRTRNDEGLRKESERLADEGVPKDEAKGIIAKKADRLVPISLVWSDDPAEHVFQFVVVNQKATPIHKALLGTILSTTLTKDETEQVRGRLEGAGIQLQQAQSVAYMTRNPDSPFFGKVETGMVGESGNKLAWSVMQSLIRIFQELKGGSLYHQPASDYADYWRKTQLETSELVNDWQAQEYESPYNAWSRPDGPWRDVFIAFYSKIRDYFADTTATDASNYWGAPKVSNLFNKISLTILASDFFQFIYQRKLTVNSTDHLCELMDEWLDGVKQDYFTGKWELQGNKKDSPGIRKRWADNWVRYRESPNKTLPPKASFGKPL